MHITILLLLLCNNLIYGNALTQCCEGRNIITTNETCWDGSNITFLSCETKILIGPTQNPPSYIEVDIDDVLVITDADTTAHVRVQSDKYCITKESENDTHVAIVCMEVEEHLPTTATIVLFYLKVVCGFISVVFLLTTLVIYIFVPGLQDIEGKCITNFVASLTVAYLLIVFLPVMAVLIQPSPCDTTAFIYFTATLSCINWMCVISFHLWRITSRPLLQAPMRWFLMYCGYGYGLPGILLITALVLHYSQDAKLRAAEESQCLFEGNIAVWAYFYGPVMIMLLLSVVLQLWAAKKVWLDTKESSQPMLHLRKKSLMYLHLLLVVSLAYALDMLSFIFLKIHKYVDYMWDVSDCRNLLLGGVIFFILVVLRPKVLKALAKHGLFCMTFPDKWESLVDEESDQFEYEEAALTQDSTGL